MVTPFPALAAGVVLLVISLVIYGNKEIEE